jgi:hypothetical protein
VKRDFIRAVGFAWKFSLICTALVLLSFSFPKAATPILPFLIPLLWLTAPGQIAADLVAAIFYQRLHYHPPYVYFPLTAIFNFLFYAALSFVFLLLSRLLNKK